MFYTSSREKALEFFRKFRARWERETPSATRCLENNLERCLTYVKFPEEEWISLRTTNSIEHLNKEFKRRTKPMEILAGESLAFRMLGIIRLKIKKSGETHALDVTTPNSISRSWKERTLN